MKIGIYNPRMGISDPGGTEAFLRTIVPHLSREHDITLYLGDGEFLDEVSKMNVTVWPIRFNPKESRPNRVISKYTPIIPAEIESITMGINAHQSGVFKHMNREMDVVSTHYYLDNILVSRQTITPTLFRFPGIKRPSIRWKAMVRLADTDTYVANSQSTARRVDEWLGIQSDGIVYPGIDMEQFSPDVEPAFDEDNFVILFVGRLDTGKGVGDLIDAHARLSENTSLYIVGDGTHRSQFEKRVNRHDTGDRVTFVGAVPHEKIHQYYTAADVFCLPSYHESFIGMVNMEAMACGVPVISTKIDAIQEQITSGNNGLLIEPGDVDALVSAIKKLHKSPALRKELATAAQKTVKQFAWPVQAEQLINHYEHTATKSE